MDEQGTSPKEQQINLIVESTKGDEMGPSTQNTSQVTVEQTQSSILSSDRVTELEQTKGNTESQVIDQTKSQATNQMQQKKKKNPQQPLTNSQTAEEKHQKKLKKQLVGENFERINYLYQCATYMSKLTTDTSLRSHETPHSSSKEAPRNTSDEVLINTSDVVRHSTSSESGSANPESLVITPPQEHRLDGDTNSQSKTIVPNNRRTQEKKAKKKPPSYLLPVSSTRHPELVANLGSTCRAIGRKCQLRLSHHIKRELCPGCASPLLPALTAVAKIVRVRKQRVLMLRCLNCGARRKRPCQDVKTLWADRPEACV